MQQCLTAILPRNALERAQAFFKRSGFTCDEGSSDEYRMLSEGRGGHVRPNPTEGWLEPNGPDDVLLRVGRPTRLRSLKIRVGLNPAVPPRPRRSVSRPLRAGLSEGQKRRSGVVAARSSDHCRMTPSGLPRPRRGSRAGAATPTAIPATIRAALRARESVSGISAGFAVPCAIVRLPMMARNE